MENIVKISQIKSYFPGLKGRIRIVTLSDLHFSKKMKITKMESILNLASTMDPDYIFWLGDNLDDTNVLEDYEKREEFLELCKKSGKIATTAISLADHDMRYRIGPHIAEDLQTEFWHEVSSFPNVHVLDNSIYEDERLHIVGYTMPTYYYHGAYPLPKNSISPSDRKDENLYVLVEDIKRNSCLFETENNKINELLFHSPLHLDNGIIQTLLSGFQHIHSGHMHEGLTPPILDELSPKTLGMISPQRTLFPKNAKGIIKSQYGTLCIINGGITKIAESQKAVLQHLNTFFPIHMNVLDIEQGDKVKKYKIEYSYQKLN